MPITAKDLAEAREVTGKSLPHCVMAHYGIKAMKLKEPAESSRRARGDGPLEKQKAKICQFVLDRNNHRATSPDPLLFVTPPPAEEPAQGRKLQLLMVLRTIRKELSPGCCRGFGVADPGELARGSLGPSVPPSILPEKELQGQPAMSRVGRAQLMMGIGGVPFIIRAGGAQLITSPVIAIPEAQGGLSSPELLNLSFHL